MFRRFLSFCQNRIKMLLDFYQRKRDAESFKLLDHMYAVALDNHLVTSREEFANVVKKAIEPKMPLNVIEFRPRQS